MSMSESTGNASAPDSDKPASDMAQARRVPQSVMRLIGRGAEQASSGGEIPAGRVSRRSIVERVGNGPVRPMFDPISAGCTYVTGGFPAVLCAPPDRRYAPHLPCPAYRITVIVMVSEAMPPRVSRTVMATGTAPGWAGAVKADSAAVGAASVPAAAAHW